MTTNNLYSNAQRYDDQYCTYTSDIGFLLTLAKKYSGTTPIAEFACGTLRVTLPLAKAGYQMIGVDIAPTMLALGKEKLGREPINVKKRIKLYEGDMRDYKTSLYGTHHLVLVPFTAFLHLSTYEDQVMALKNFWSHLNPDEGYLLVDIFNPDVKKLAAGTGPTIATLEKNMLIDDGRRRLIRWHASQYTPENQEVKWMFFVEIYDTQTNLLKEKYYEEATVRIIFPQEWRQLLRNTGFTILEEWGDYDMCPFEGSGSRRMLFLAKRTHEPLV